LVESNHAGSVFATHGKDDGVFEGDWAGGKAMPGDLGPELRDQIVDP
jgi:hypothetical protein